MASEACIDAAWIGTPHSELAAFSSSNAVVEGGDQTVHHSELAAFSSSNAIDAAIVAVIRRYDAAIVAVIRRYDAAIVGGTAKLIFLRRYVRPNPR